MDGWATLTKAGRHTRLAAVAGAAVAVALLTIPLFGDYVIWMTANMLILALFAVGFNLLFSFTGLLSFGQAAFFAVGGYVCAKILLAVPSLLLGVIGGVLAAGVAALIIGFLCVRHTEIYFAMLTLAFGMMIHSIIWKWRSVTGGDDGLVGVPRAPLEIPGLFSVGMAELDRYYYFVLVLVALGIFAVWRVVRSSLGLTLQSIRDSESRVTFSGLSVRKYRLIAFTIAGLASGLAGALMIPLGRKRPVGDRDAPRRRLHLRRSHRRGVPVLHHQGDRRHLHRLLDDDARHHRARPRAWIPGRRRQRHPEPPAAVADATAERPGRRPI
ncbi:MAG TPA: branched-chain amino acid ABC transporter permease, partial [Rhodospirillales bacterium]